MLRFQDDGDQPLDMERFTTEEKSNGLAELLYDSNDKSFNQERMPDASNAKYHSAEHIFASGIGPSSNKFQSGIQPIKLNFEDEKQAKDMEAHPSGMSNQYSGNLAMANIPSLKDLQTSNMFTDQFQGDDAEYYAMQNINDEQHEIMQRV